MEEKKTTIMVLKVDLECKKCYKKVKNLLCKFPQIRDQIFDEKANTVTITVVCCSPEKIRDKLCCKGRGTIKSIEIKEPEKKKVPEKPKPAPEKPKPVEKSEPVVVVVPPKPASSPPPAKAPEPAPPASVPEPKAPPPAPKVSDPVPVAAYPPSMYPSYGVCCGPCSDGRPGGPCYGGYGMPMTAPPCNCGCGGRRSICCDYGYGRGGYTVIRCDDYFSEENASGCVIM